MERGRAYDIRYAEGIADDLASLRAYERARVLDVIEKELIRAPNLQTRNRKILVGLIPPWQHIPPVWQLRIGEHRVFYDVDEASHTVIVRAIRHKAPHRTTEEIL